MKNNKKKNNSVEPDKQKNEDLVVVDNPEILPQGNLAKLREKSSQIVIGTLNIFASPINPGKKTPHLTSGKKRQAFDLLVFLIILALGAVAFFFWFIFSPKIAPVEIRINCQPETVRSGERVDCKIKYTSEHESDLLGANLALNLPEYFVLDSIENENFDAQNKTFKLGDLKPGVSSEVEFSGYIWGEIGIAQEIQTVFSCRDQQDRSKYKIESIDFNLNESLIDLEVELPDKIYSQADFETKFKYTNNATQKIENANLILNYPQNYKLKDFEGGLDQVENDRFKIVGLEAGETGELILTGNLDEAWQEESTWQDFSADLNIEISEKDLLQDSFSKSVEVDFANFEFMPSWKPRVGTPGDFLSYKLNYKNNEDCNIENLKIWLEVESYMVDFKNLKNQLEGEQTLVSLQIDGDNKKIIWSDLDNLDLDQSGEVAANLKLFKQIPVNNYETAKNFTIKITPKASYNLASLPGQEVVAVGDTDVVLVNSNLDLTAQARYFTDYGDQLGIGPMPPAVGEETRYWISLDLTNGTNEVEDLNLDIDLAPGVRWTGKTSVSHGRALNYNSGDHSVTWSLDKMRIYVGRVSPAYQLGFEVGVTPNENQVGQILSLVNSILLTGRDSFTGFEIIKNVGQLTTELKYDKFIDPEMYRVEEW